MGRGKRNEQSTGLDIALFERKVLQTDEGVEHAFDILDSLVYRNDVGLLIEQLLSKKGLFEYVLSSCSEVTADVFISNIMSRFSVVLGDTSSSIPHKLLQRLPRVLYFLPFEQNEQPTRLSEYQSSVELNMKILAVLANANFSVDASNDASAQAKALVGIKAKSTQRAKKQAKKAARPIIQDTTPFDLAGLKAPETAEDASMLVVEVLSRQQGMLKDLLEVLRKPSTRELVRAVYVFDSKLSAPCAEKKNEMPNTIIFEQDNEAILERESTAYPAIQSMKSALYFENADGFGEWPIHISGRAGRDLRSHRKNGATFDIILKKLKELSNAHFSEDNQKKLNHHDHEVPIFEAKMTRDLRLVYQTDCVAEGDYERQIIKVYGVYTHAQLEKNRLWDSVSCHLMSKRGKDYRDKCIFRNVLPDRTVAPAYFPPSAKSDEQDNAQSRQPHQEDLEELHSLLVLDKFVVFSQAYLNNVIADQEATYPFDVSPQEQQIIEHPSSCYVIGRSGTGKTTTMMFKMLAIEKSYSETNFLSDRSKPRQVFVTQSRHLAQRVEDYFRKLLTALEAGGKSAEEMASFVRKKAKDLEDLIDDEDIENWRSDLPDRFSQLEDQHFPLFLTFDRLCSLIEKDLELCFLSSSTGAVQHAVTEDHRPNQWEKSRMGISLKASEAAVAGSLQFANKHTSTTNASFVTYEVFKSEYWPHFSQSLTKGLDPVLVFNEFLGIIKGSEPVLSSDEGFLDRGAYLAVSDRSHATFATQRPAIYDLFEMYQKRKRSQKQFDAADRTMSILRGVEQKSLLGRKADFLYVDEVQDNLLIDAKLLRLVCANPKGRFWAGDTAQTISMGSAFRLNELRAMHYRHEGLDSRSSAPAEQPPLFQLTMNYRSHGGIVDCASSVIEILSHFWPNSLDALAKETGSVSGIKPIFFTDWDQDSVRYEQFLFGDADSGQRIEFGASQCILVRNDRARDRLRREVGEIGVIMTLYESKGLEFNDVLLYNFFADSLISQSQWRVVLNMLQDSSTPPPLFDEVRHAGVCHELKCLYVAITRGRKNVWIVDSSDRSEPMRLFWTDRALIQICTPAGGVDLPRLAVSSTTEEWAETGRTLFRNKRYWQAMHCFQRANMLLERDVAYAYHMRVQARLVPRTTAQAQNRRLAYVAAADAFQQCSVRASSTSNARATYLRNAGDCFVEAEDDSSAAVAYYDAGMFTLAVQCYRKIGLFDEAVKVIMQHSNAPLLDPVVADRVMEVAKIHYFKKEELEKAAKLFTSVDDQLSFVNEWGLDVAEATLLETEGRFYDAAELHREEGRAEDAMRLYLSAINDPRAVRRAVQCILEAFRKLFYVAVSPPKSDTSLQQLRDYVSKLKDKLKDGTLGSNERHEVMLFLALANDDRSMLLQLLPTFQQAKNDSVCLLILESIVNETPKPKTATSIEMVHYLADFERYVRVLLRLAMTNQPHESLPAQHALGFRLKPGEDLIVLSRDTIFSAVLDRATTHQSPDDEDFQVPLENFQSLFQRALLGRVRERIQVEISLCRRTRVLHSCLQFALFERCNSESCFREHIGRQQLSVDWFNSRIRLRFQQILILQRLDSSSTFGARAREKLFWLENLCDALFPLFSIHGHFTNIQVEKIPESPRATQVLREWLREFFFRLHIPAPSGYGHAGYGSSEFLSILVKTAVLAFTVDYAEAHHFISESYAVKLIGQAVPPSFYRPNGAYIVHDVLRFLEGEDPAHVQAGCLFLSHILENKLFMNAGALCILIDRLFASVILHGSFTSRGTLHGLTLPRSWMLLFLRGLRSTAPMYSATSYLAGLVSKLGELLQGLIADTTDMLYFERSDRLGFTVKTVFIARVCFSLCALGDNVGFSWLKALIFRAITTAGKKIAEVGMHPRIYRDYMEAKDWNALSRAARQSYYGSQLDELVQLCHDRPGQRSLPVLHGARRITYKTLDEIPRLLNPTHGLVSLTSSLNATAPTFQPRQATIALPPQIPGIQSRLPIPAVDQDSTQAESETAQEDPDAPEEQVEGWAPANSSSSWSEAHVKAVNTINKYRRLKTRRQFGSARSLLHFKMTSRYHEAAEKMEWPHRYYRILFRGPIPILRVCIEEAYDHIFLWKRNAKRNLISGGHEDTEMRQDELTLIKPMFNEAIELRKFIEEGSSFHRSRDLEKLKTLVQRTSALITQIPNLDKTHLNEEITTCLKAVVWQPAPPKQKKAKPSLNVDDLDEY